MTKVTAPSEAVRRQVLAGADFAALRRGAATVERWPAGSHAWGQYAEATANGPAICRTENVSACHPAIAALVAGGLRELAAAALGEPATAFKDKINYKQPGGAGFHPHQDRLAYPGVDRVLSILIAIDECSTASGCLWLADGVDTLLPTDDRGVVLPDVAQELRWTPAELAPGDAVLIDGFSPHFSDANRTAGPRRVLVASYAPSSEGYGRDRYYAARAQAMTRASGTDGRFRISTLADFGGTEVPADGDAVDACIHAPVEEESPPG